MPRCDAFEWPLTCSPYSENIMNTPKKENPEPPEDLRVDWENEDIELENRKPTLAEDEEDTSEL